MGIICDNGVVSHARATVAERLVGAGDIPERPFSGRVVGMQVRMQLLRQPAEGAFDLFVGCPRRAGGIPLCTGWSQPLYDPALHLDRPHEIRPGSAQLSAVVHQQVEPVPQMPRFSSKDYKVHRRVGVYRARAAATATTAIRPTGVPFNAGRDFRQNGVRARWRFTASLQQVASRQ
jgi:hypothetical protein